MSDVDELSQSSEMSFSSEESSKAMQRVQADDDDADEVIAKNDTRLVKCSKMMVLIVIMIAAGACGTATYLFTSNEEDGDFVSQFRDFAVDIADTSHLRAESTFGFVESFGKDITKFADMTDLQWPEVSLPDFEIRGLANNAHSSVLQLTFAPLLKASDLPTWNPYSVTNQGWIEEGVHVNAELHPESHDEDFHLEPITEYLWKYRDGLEGPKLEQTTGQIDFTDFDFAAVWQQSPAPHDTEAINMDLFSQEVFRRIFHGMWETNLPVLSEVLQLEWLYEKAVQDDSTHPHSFLLQPVYERLSSNDELGGVVVAVIPWDSYFLNLLPNNIVGIDVVVEDTCDQKFTYRINGANAIYVGEGDHHEKKYSEHKVSTEFAPFLQHEFSDAHDHCEYTLHIYPSSKFESNYETTKPAIYTTVVVAVFFFTAMIFMSYDFLVQRRQRKIMALAKRSTKIVSSLFPSAVRDRIIRDAEHQAELEIQKKGKFRGTNAQLKSFLDESPNAYGLQDSKPIAELFPETTIMFGDIVGFTAWSSVREPSQVFTLLETVYRHFDELAAQRRVFKVETVGDCYVAVTGLPEPMKDHALVMARFARDCIEKMNDLTKKLEVALGPDTGDLCLRIGLHSGPVTAGVLRGDKSRFQLFGDTVNTAARVESSGDRNRIHVSTETADLLVAAGKQHWLTERHDILAAKGKDAMQTYWLQLKGPVAQSTSSNDENDDAEEVEDEGPEEVHGDKPVSQKQPIRKPDNEKEKRLIDWNTDVLCRLLRHIIARRNAADKRKSISDGGFNTVVRQEGQTVIDEVKEIIELPQFDMSAAKRQVNPETIELPATVETQVRDYITIVASMYHDNPFHNFEHASHVTMSVVKLLSRIVAPDSVADETNDMNNLAHELHDHTYGITSDPLTQFSCVLAALIHDVDHTGVPNAQLVKEKVHIAEVYKGKSVAEQNSVDVAWDLLMDTSFKDLRRVVYTNNNEMHRFRQLVVNAVMATDIVDKELKNLRNARWERAFSTAPSKESDRLKINRKATIVIEHLIQASDIAHTMQHWHIYRKWNERLYEEMYRAYKQGRAEKNPAEFWYKGEIGFFDFYIIPLADKLKDCGVFGVSSDEYLNYAKKNRQEWERKGQEVVESMIEKYREKYSYLPDPLPVMEEPVAATPVPKPAFKPAAAPKPTPVVAPKPTPVVAPKPVAKSSPATPLVPRVSSRPGPERSQMLHQTMRSSLRDNLDPKITAPPKEGRMFL